MRHEVSLEVLPSHIASDGLSRAICGSVPEQASSEAEQDENRRTGVTVIVDRTLI